MRDILFSDSLLWELNLCELLCINIKEFELRGKLNCIFLYLLILIN